MKVKSLLLTVLTIALFTGCNSEEGKDTDYPDRSLIGKAFLSLSLQSNTGPSTRADGTIDEQPGSEDESKATDVKVLLFDNNERCLGIKTVTGAQIGNSEGSSNPTATASDAIAVPADTKKVFVVINPFEGGWDFTEEVVKGKTWNEINTAIDATIDNVATAQKFMMASAGYTRGTDKSVTDIGALTDVSKKIKKPTDYTTENIEKAQNDAKNDPTEVYVDRLSCKVTVSLKGTGVTKPTNTEFEFKGWKLSVTNKSTRLYSDLVDYGDKKTKGAVYRKDKNYLESEQPDKSKTEALRAAFDYLENIDKESDNMPAVDIASGTSAYCLENTMEAKAQQLGFTTKVVVKANYTPDGIAKDASYFSWNGKYYTLTALQDEYNKNGSGLKTDLPIFLNKAGLMKKDVFEGSNQDAKDEVVADLTEGSFTANTGIIGRFCAVRYYHESVCYYDILIRHDKNITEKMALGRWGVVRNNWYSIEIQNVTGPGTPWIPDPSDPGPTPTNPDPGPGPDPGPDPEDPYNPTPPDVDDDDNDVYLSVKITINPWTSWTQEAELH